MDADTVYCIFNREDLKKEDKFIKAGWVCGLDANKLPCVQKKYYKGISEFILRFISAPNFQQELSDRVLRDNVISEAQMHFDIHHEPLKMWCPNCKRKVRIIGNQCSVCYKTIKEEE